MRMKLLVVLATLSLANAFAQAQVAPSPSDSPAAIGQADPDPSIVDLSPVIVTGSQPGPGLWRVSKGDHVLWILGTQSPLPRRIDWDTTVVERTLAQSQQMIGSPWVGLQKEIGVFRGLTLMPTALRARRNPDGRTLEDIVPPAQYTRWRALKLRYIGAGNRGIEEWRPVFAALELYEKAIERSGMSLSNAVGKEIARIARRKGVKTVQVKVEIAIDDPRRALKEFAASPLDDLDCFEKTLNRIERDLGNMAARANAWSVGDIDALRDLPVQNQFVACSVAFTEAGLARKYGIDDLQQQIERKWLATAEAALTRNRSTFALLPISQLLKADGYLSKLEAKGYVVEAP
jgi:TraB/PrgY/gumN family